MYSVSCVGRCLSCIQTCLSCVGRVWSDIDLNTFHSSGIAVTNIVDFMTRVTGNRVEPQPVVERPGT